METALSAASGTYADQKGRNSGRILECRMCEMCEICTQLCSDWRQRVFAFPWQSGLRGKLFGKVCEKNTSALRSDANLQAQRQRGRCMYLGDRAQESRTAQSRN